jgi:hypothetical protein
MKNNFSSSVVAWAAVFFISAAFPRLLAAQSTTTKEVEIDVAGPFGYVPDVVDSVNPQNYIVIVASSAHHGGSVVPEGDANHYQSNTGTITLVEGYYQLNFNVTSCGPQPAGIERPKLYGATVNNTVLPTLINGSSHQFAVRLPKPCYYESYIESSVKLGQSPITSSSPETAYTTWMVLHYTVDASLTSATLTDQGNNTKTVTFKASQPSSLAGIAIALSMNAVPSPACDFESSMAFADAATFWGFTAPSYVLFPDISSSLQQTRRYNYKASGCTKADGHWPLTPGRADCHAAQVNVNGTVQ